MTEEPEGAARCSSKRREGMARGHADGWWEGEGFTLQRLLHVHLRGAQALEVVAGGVDCGSQRRAVLLTGERDEALDHPDLCGVALDAAEGLLQREPHVPLLVGARQVGGLDHDPRRVAAPCMLTAGATLLLRRDREHDVLEQLIARPFGAGAAADGAAGVEGGNRSRRGPLAGLAQVRFQGALAHVFRPDEQRALPLGIACDGDRVVEECVPSVVVDRQRAQHGHPRVLHRWLLAGRGPERAGRGQERRMLGVMPLDLLAQSAGVGVGEGAALDAVDLGHGLEVPDEGEGEIAHLRRRELHGARDEPGRLEHVEHLSRIDMQQRSDLPRYGERLDQL